MRLAWVHRGVDALAVHLQFQCVVGRVVADTEVARQGPRGPQQLPETVGLGGKRGKRDGAPVDLTTLRFALRTAGVTQGGQQGKRKPRQRPRSPGCRPVARVSASRQFHRTATIATEEREGQ